MILSWCIMYFGLVQECWKWTVRFEFSRPLVLPFIYFQWLSSDTHCYKVRSYGYNSQRNGACEKHDQLRRLATFPPNKARTLKPINTAFEFSLQLNMAYAIPPPAKMEMDGDLRENWALYKLTWVNYAAATDIGKKSNKRTGRHTSFGNRQGMSANIQKSAYVGRGTSRHTKNFGKTYKLLWTQTIYHILTIYV